MTQRGFFGLSEQAKQDIWLALYQLALLPDGDSLGLLGRLKPAVSIERAQSEMAVVFQTVVNAPDAGPFVK